MRNKSSDLKLQESTFQRILALWEPEIDLFSSTWNRQMDRFVSWGPQPESMAVDAFSLSWTNRRGYAFPPFNMIARCLTKIMKEKAELILMAPVWHAQPWWSTIMELACHTPRIICPEIALLSDPLGNPRPLLDRGSLLLAVWMLSGKVSKTAAFRSERSSCSWEVIVRTHQLATRAHGTVCSIGALNGINIPCLLL